MVDIPRVGSFSAADFSAGLQAAMFASEQESKTRQQILELVFRSGIEAQRAAEERRRIGLEEQKLQATLPGIEAQTGLAKESLRLAEEQRASKQRFGEFAKTHQRMSELNVPLADKDVFGAFAKAHPVEALDLTQARQDEIKIRELENRLQQLQELFPVEKRRAEAGAKAEEELLEPRKKVISAEAREREARASEAEQRQRLLSSPGGKLISGVSGGFSDEDLRRVNMTREDIESEINDAIVGLAAEGKPATTASVRQQVLENLKNVAALRTGIEALESVDVQKGKEVAPNLKATVDSLLPSVSKQARRGQVSSVEEAIDEFDFTSLEKALEGSEGILKRRKIDQSVTKEAVQEQIAPLITKKILDTYEVKDGKVIGLTKQFTKDFSGFLKSLGFRGEVEAVMERQANREIESLNRIISKYGIVVPDNE